MSGAPIPNPVSLAASKGTVVPGEDDSSGSEEEESPAPIPREQPAPVADIPTARRTSGSGPESQNTVRIFHFSSNKGTVTPGEDTSGSDEEEDALYVPEKTAEPVSSGPLLAAVLPEVSKPKHSELKHEDIPRSAPPREAPLFVDLRMRSSRVVKARYQVLKEKLDRIDADLSQVDRMIGGSTRRPLQEATQSSQMVTKSLNELAAVMAQAPQRFFWSK